METYSFSCDSQSGIKTTISFDVKTDGLNIKGFAVLCAIAAKAFGYQQSNIEDVFDTCEEELYDQL